MPDRVFVAIDLREGTRASLADATAVLLQADPSWAGEKPVAPPLLHVTLAFIGPVPDAALGEFVERLHRAAGAIESFDLRIAAVRAMPSARRATMAWAALDDPCSGAALLAARVADAAGLPEGSRPFRPHVTLVRARRPHALAPAAIAAAGAVLSAPGKEADRTVSVPSVTVYSSTLGASGPTYSSLAKVLLTDGGTRARTD
jgi:2'-5' RNA ligase